MKHLNLKKYKLAKSVLSIVLAFCVMLGSFGFLPTLFTEAATPEIWGGQSDLSAPADSDSDGVYEITKASELAYVIANGSSGKSYILTKDIYLNDISKVNWQNGTAGSSYTLNSWYDSYNHPKFSGSFDGNGHIVYGLYIKIGSSYSYYSTGAGLFPAVDGASEIKNLGVDYAFVDYECYSSAFVGTATNSSSVTIDGCFAGANVYLKGYGAAAFRGYAAGMSTTIKNSYSLASFNSTGNQYGFIAATWGTANISNSFIVGAPLVSASDDYYVTVTDSYQTVNGGVAGGVTIDAENMKGTDVFTDAAKMPNLNADSVFTAQTGFPVLSVFESLLEVEITPPEIWGGQSDLSAPADSDSDGVYEITKASELAYIIKNGAEGKSYVLTKDIYLNDVSKINWQTGAIESGYTVNAWYGNYESTPFSGKIDGNGHIVYGMYFNIGTSYGAYYDYTVGLFPGVEGTAEIKNLGVDKMFINYESFAAVFVGRGAAGANLTIDGCYAGADVYIKAYSASAFRGSSKGMDTTISNCYSLATMNAQGGEYGFAGYIWGTLNIANSFNANGPLVSQADDYYTHITDSYETAVGGAAGAVKLTADNMKGTDVFTNSAKMPNLNTNNLFTAQTGFPVLSVFESLIGTEPEPEPGPGPGTEPEPDNTKVWGGQSDLSAPADSDSDGVYEITKASELAYIIKNGAEGKSFILTDDIYLNDITKVNWQTGIAESGYTINAWYGNYESTPFSGKIDGNGHIVYGMYFNVGTSYGAYYDYTVGLFPGVEGTAEIKNLGVDKVFINYESFASAFVGRGAAGANLTIDGCYAGADVYIKAYSASAFRGSSKGMDTTISNCYSLATMNAQGGGYGLAGYVWGNLNVTNSFNSNGPVLSDTNDYQVTIANSYQTANGGVNSGTTTLTADNMKGADVLTNSAKMSNLNSEGYFVAKEGFPEFAVFNGLPITPPTPGPDPDDPDDPDDPGPTPPPADPVDPRAWDGSLKAPKDSDGNGVYEITNAAEFAYVIKNGGGGKYKLTDDIYLNDIAKINWQTGVVASGYTPNAWFDTNNSAKFKGSIDGAGHTVYGMYHNGGNSSFSDYIPYSIGLIPGVEVSTAVEIKNLGVDNAYIHYECYASALVGRVGLNGADSAVIFENCYIGEKVNITAYSAAAFRGYTYNGATAIKNCYSLATLNSNGGYKGLVAMVWGETEIINSYNAGGPIIGDFIRDFVTIKNCYQTENGGAADTGAVTVTADNMKGADALTAASKMPLLNEDNVFIAGEGFPVNYVFTDAYTDSDEPDQTDPRVWDGSIAESLKGNGTEKEPYLISNGSELAFAIKSGGNGAFYKLTDDIYLNDITKMDWSTGKPSSVGYRANSWFYNLPFEGTLDGDGHTVYGLYYKTSTEEAKYFYGAYGVGLIPRVEEGKSVSVMKLGVDCAYISFECGSSAIVGQAGAGSVLRFDQCYVGENTVIRGNGAGALRGLCYEAEITISNCYSLATTEAFGPGATKGLLGNVWGPLTIIHSYNGNGPLTDSYERWNVVFEDCFQTVTGVEGETGVVTLNADAMKGANALVNMPGLNKYEAYIVSDIFPVLNIFHGGKGAISFTDEGVKGRVWSGKLATKFAGGTGTADDPYLIETPEQLALLISKGSGSGKNYYKLTADIKLNDTSKSNWEKNATQWFAGMSAFRGVFDGDGHVVSGMYYNGEQDSKSYAVGLFQRLGCDSVIRRVGVTNSKIYAQSQSGIALAGAIVGWAEDFNPDGNPDKKAPLISQCFADDTVFIEGTSAGGIVGGAPTVIEIDNCYFTGELTGKNFAGAIVGDAWAGDGHGPILTNCYAATLDRDATGGGDAFRAMDVAKGKTTLKNVYVDGIDQSGTANMLSVMYMRGKEAKSYLKGFDFGGIWQTVEGGSPVLSCFENAKEYSCMREPKKVTISFGNLGGVKLEAVTGIPGYTPITEDTIPSPYRYGFLFKGWHHFNEFGADFELTVFPDFDITIYAQWEEVGFSVGFENDFDEKYDFNSGIELFKPGIPGYNYKFVKNGWRSLHAKADSDVAPTFLVSYEHPLQVGKEYHFTIWLSAENEGASGEIKLIHTEHPDVNLKGIGWQTAFNYSGLKPTEWTKYEFKFIANAPYIMISSPVGQSLFFEDIQVVPTGEEGKTGGLEKIETLSSASEPVGSTANIIVIAVVAAAVTALAVLCTLLIIKKRKKVK